jgi:putative ABC transport system ATP-binding protein
MIALEEVRKVFQQGRPDEFHALRGIDLSLAEGGITIIAGASGSGKTTLLSILGCLARPTTGRVRWQGRVLSALPERFLADIRRRGFGMVFQRSNLIAGLSALENVMIPAYPLGGNAGALRRRARDLLAQFGLADKENSKPEWLSGGEAQRVAIARALVNDPPVVLADEPTAHLDDPPVRRFLDIVATLRGEGRTVVISSHDPRVTQSPIVDAVVTLADGELAHGELAHGQPAGKA